MPTGIYKRKPRSEITKNKIRKALLGKKGSLQKSINLSKALKGKPKSKEFIENLRKIRTGWKFSDITKKKISEKLKGNKNGWKGSNAKIDTGRTRARRIYSDIKPCRICGINKNICRHHIDGNTLNNKIENIDWLCIKHHIMVHKINKI